MFWWMHGIKYGIVDNRTTPLFNMESALIFRCRDDGPDRIAVTSLEIVYYTDAATGQHLQRWQNPYTLEGLDVRNVPLGPTTLRYSPGGADLPTELPGAKLSIEHGTAPMTVEGNDVWIRDDMDAVATFVDGKAPPFLVHDWAIYHGQRNDIENRKLTSAPCTVSFIDLTNWPRWMKMGDRPGTFMTRAVGRKEGSLAAMPASFLAILKARHPAVYADPASALEQPANHFER